MSSSVSSRPLSLVPFLAADGVLLLTALVIAWRASEELAGGALAGVVICMCLGAVLTVLPFVLNDAREREAALADRQRELVDLVNSTTATASRWGAQWAAAATGLEDASTLAARSLAAADRAPAALQEKIDALSALLEQSERTARERDVFASQHDEALGARSADIAGMLAKLETTAASFERIDAGLRERHAAFAASLAEVHPAIARAQAVRGEIDAQAAAVPAQISAHAEQLDRVAMEAGARLNAMAALIAGRVTELETTLVSVAAQLEHVKALASEWAAFQPSAPQLEPASTSDSAPAPAIEPTPTSTPTLPAVPIKLSAGPVPSALPVAESSREQPVLTVSVTPEAVPAPKPVNVICQDAIMDPFYIPDNGYSALADAMDGERA